MAARAVWKYKIEISDTPTALEVPKGATVCTVAMQGGALFVWLLVNPNATEVVRKYVVRGTGHSVLASELYVGTAFDGPFVWHVFEC